ncbi:MAG: ABC-F family ATP-binding cassette domain-containing protein [Candidatus Handelsmanbacteria bacterium]|nr:ABC-F family ATP-binding cassette domain-containing protein [Candidatus Handelsmanbacteria bacterium]
MSMIVAEGVGKYYGALDVFKNLSFRVEPADHIGLVGANGEGKTTLLRLLAGLEEPTSGSLQRRRGLRVGYLPQDPPDFGSATLWEVMLEVFALPRKLEAELAGLARQLEAPSHGEEVLARYSALQEEYERQGGYTYETRIRAVLMGLGFAAPQFEQELGKLSGGQRTRALLARLLLEEPDLLLLDEPTNHLDLRAVEWLEGWVQEFKGGLLVVSHDRYFLDKCSAGVWEIAFGGLETYRGNYTAHLRQRQERYERRLKEWEAQQEYIEKTQDFIRRYLAGQRSKEAQGRRTRLERYLATEAVEKPRQQRRIRLRLEGGQRSGDIVLQLRGGVAVGYAPGRALAQVPDQEVLRGQRIAVVGPNGAGKTTLIRSILGELDLLEGEIRYGAAVEPGYLAQAHDHLDPKMTVLEAVRQARPQLPAEEVRNLLGSLLFSGDDAFKKVGELSGGQRSRVALAKLVLNNANLLVLDEPTNHLDIASQEILEEVLGDFPGTLILVSHDRYLIQALATEVWLVDGGRVQRFPGNWEEFLRWRDQQEAPPPARGAMPRPEGGVVQRQAQKQERRGRKQQEKWLQRQQELEERIHQQELELQGLSERIGRAGEDKDMDQVYELGAEYRQREKELEGLLEEWEELAGELEMSQEEKRRAPV